MKKAAVLILLFLSFTAAKGQDRMTYVPLFIDRCKNEVNNRDYTRLTTRLILQNSNGETCEVTFDSIANRYCFKINDLGHYKLRHKSDDYNITRGPFSEITIDGKERIIFDSIYLPMIIESGYYELDLYTYMKCGEYIDGYQEEYYHNGNIRLKGTFKSGYLIDTLYQYRLDGTLMNKEYRYDQVSVYQETYYLNGKLKQLHQPILINGSYSYKIPHIPDSFVNYTNRMPYDFNPNYEEYKYDTSGNLTEYYYTDSLTAYTEKYIYRDNKPYSKSVTNHKTKVSITYLYKNGEWIEQKQEE